MNAKTITIAAIAAAVVIGGAIFALYSMPSYNKSYIGNNSTSTASTSNSTYNQPAQSSNPSYSQAPSSGTPGY